ncbi:MAG: sulfurtransferase TusA family protein [Krumholzibacteria bacterium]|nr:sulfurtransferase TusA family protein [Candidatus Krumholzibacteria bacterium]
MSKRIDARGLSCPQPVVLSAQQVVAGNLDFEIVVDTEVSCENVRRFLSAKGYRIARNEEDDGIVLRANRS